jgi:pimeloyl-ACP methyl ester carboxylesterase
VEALLHVDSEDGLALAGAAVLPQGRAKPVAIVWIHGNTGTFHDYPYVVVARELAARGYPVVLGNTRGSGIASEVWSVADESPVAGGSAWELLEEAPLDVAAWVDAAHALGPSGVVVVGHSQGAAKAVLYAAERHDERLRGVVLASPDLHGHWGTVVEESERLVEAGRGDELLPPLMGAAWYRLSAGNVVSRARVLAHLYASDDAEPLLAAVHAPLLAFFGAEDVGGESELETVHRNARAAATVETVRLSAGDHVYTDAEPEAAELIAHWIDRQLPSK